MELPSFPIENRFVAICDVLGFSEMVMKNDLNAIIEKYSILFLNSADGSKMTIRNIDNENAFTEIIHKIKYTIFSDTILAWTDPFKGDINDLRSFLHLISFLQVMLTSSLIFETPVRAGVAYGETYFRNAINEPNNPFVSPQYVGRPIINAHRIEENQDWIGCAFHESCLGWSEFSRFLDNRPFNQGNPQETDALFVSYEIPLKKDVEKGLKDSVLEYALNWPFQLTRYDSPNLLRDRIQKFLERKVNECGVAIPDKHRPKYAKTLDFFNIINKREYMKNIFEKREH